MSEPTPSDDRFPFKPLFGALTVAVGVAGSIVTLIAFFAPSVSALLGRHWWMGWVFAGIATVLSIIWIQISSWISRRGNSAIVSGEVERRLGKMAPRLRAEAIEALRLETIEGGAQARSDAAVITQLWGSFGTGGRLYRQLDLLPSNKYFSTELSDAFYDLQERLDRENWQAYSDDAQQALADAATKMRAYWEPIRPLLDGTEGVFDLKIIEPPGGAWGCINVGDGSWERNPDADPWEEFYSFVRSLDPLKHEFLRAMDRLERCRKDLRLRARVAAAVKDPD